MRFNLWKDCNREPLTHLLSFIVDNRGKTVPTSENGHKLIATNCVTNNTLFPTYEKIRYLSDETYKSWFRAHPLPGDILFVNKGTPGKVCMVPDPVDFCIAQDMIALRADDSKVYNKYLFAVLRSFEIQNQITSTSVGDVIPHFKKSFLDQLMIPVPDRKTQKAIGDLYYTLSLKIEHNKKINQNLEEQAQLIFKNIFIDNKYQAVKQTSLGCICSCKLGGTPSRSKPEYWNGNIPWINSGEVNRFRIITPSEFITAEGLDHSATKLLPPKTTVLAITGATLGQVSLLEIESCANQSVVGIIPNEKLPYEFIYPFIQTNMKELISHQTGGAQQHINTKDVEGLPILLPTSSVLKEYCTLVTPLYAAIAQNCFESEYLIQLRDTLLPKLMSGELDVSTLDI